MLKTKKRSHTEEWKQENSERTKEWHENNTHPMLGTHHTEEAKLKMSDATKEKWANGKHSPESIKQGAIKRRMDPIREQAIVQAYEQGETIPQIMTKLNAQTSSIYRVLKRNNILLRQR